MVKWLLTGVLLIFLFLVAVDDFFVVFEKSIADGQTILQATLEDPPPGVEEPPPPPEEPSSPKPPIIMAPEDPPPPPPPPPPPGD